MRRLAVLAGAALALAACSNDATSPRSGQTLDEAGAYGTALTVAGGYDAQTYQNRLINGLPDSLRLSDDQRARIKALIEAFDQSTKADRDALNAVLREAKAAVEAKKSRDEVQAILAKGTDARKRLADAEAKLKSDIDAVLTAEQRAWLAAHSPAACRAEKFPPLTDAQKSQIRSLEAAFQQNNKADLDLVKSILDEAQSAVKAGKSRDEVAAILQKAVAPMARLMVARKDLRDAILNVLTPEQKASGCFPLG